MEPSAAVGSETLGQSVPPLTQHSIVCSLPAWKDNIGFTGKEKRVVDLLAAGYPRFWVHLHIQKLAKICQQKFGVDGEECLLVSSKKIADECQRFILERAALVGTPASVRLVEYTVGAEETPAPTRQRAQLHIVFFPADLSPIATQFWQHTGLGISSRYAEHCLSLLRGQDLQEPESSGGASQSSGTIMRSSMVKTEGYGQNSPLNAGAFAKLILRKRIARLVVTGDVEDGPQELCSGAQNVNGAGDVGENDVFIFQTGMTAIWNAHQLCLRARPVAKSVCFGFLNLDTLRVLEKWGPGVHFFGHALDSDIDALEHLLEEESGRDPTKPPVLALVTEIPSNPLLRSVDLLRLRALADKYDFLLIIDETIGNFVNVEVLSYADIVVTSLSKMFSGAANVMGGSLVLNPKGRHYACLKSHMDTYEDTYFDEDAVVMEYNSRDLVQRVRIVNDNTQAICAFLRTRSVAEGVPSAVIKEVFYPKYTTPTHYLRYKRSEGGYGGMFTLTFTSMAASVAFHDALDCYKGPSLGTNFSLACPFVALAFPSQYEWAAQYGVEEALVRINVGMEDRDLLMRALDTALKVAEAA